MALASIEGAITFIGGTMTFVEGAVTFIGKEGSAIGGSFKIAGVRVSAVKGVNKYNLRWRLITYKLKRPLLLIYSLISASDHSVGLSL